MRDPWTIAWALIAIVSTWIAWHATPSAGAHGLIVAMVVFVLGMTYLQTHTRWLDANGLGLGHPYED